MATSSQAQPPFLGTHRAASIAASNAAIAAGSMFYSPGSVVIRAEDGAVMTLRGVGLSASFQAAPPMVVSSAAPVNADGMPDGTVYIQTP